MMPRPDENKTITKPRLLVVEGVEELFRCLPGQGVPLPKNMAKARIQAFLASREEPGKRLGEAAEAGCWPWDHKAFDGLKTLLRQMRGPKAGA